MKQLVVFVCSVYFAPCSITHMAVSILGGAHPPGFGEIVLVSCRALPSHGNTTLTLFFGTLHKFPQASVLNAFPVLASVLVPMNLGG